MHVFEFLRVAFKARAFSFCVPPVSPAAKRSRQTKKICCSRSDRCRALFWFPELFLLPKSQTRGSSDPKNEGSVNATRRSSGEPCVVPRPARFLLGDGENCVPRAQNRSRTLFSECKSPVLVVFDVNHFAGNGSINAVMSAFKPPPSCLGLRPASFR